MSGYADIDQAVRLMRSGAVDFITKPFDMTAFLDRVSSSLRSKRQDEPNSSLGISRAMREAEQMLRRYASHPSPFSFRERPALARKSAPGFCISYQSVRSPLSSP